MVHPLKQALGVDDTTSTLSIHRDENGYRDACPISLGQTWPSEIDLLTFYIIVTIVE